MAWFKADLNGASQMDACSFDGPLIRKPTYQPVRP
jgi:hypothetical protein